jgi:hypothetical protein
MEEFFCFLNFFPFSKKYLASHKSKNFFFEEIRKKLLGKENESEKRVILYNFFNGPRDPSKGPTPGLFCVLDFGQSPKFSI